MKRGRMLRLWWLGVFCIAGCDRISTLSGSAQSAVSSGASRQFSYSISYNRTKNIVRIAINNETIWSGDAGSMRPLNAYTRLTAAGDPLLCVEAESGAGSLRLICILMGQECLLVLDETSRFGFSVVEYDSDLEPEVVGIYGDLVGPKIARVFDLVGDAFEIESVQTFSDLPYFEIRGQPLD